MCWGSFSLSRALWSVSSSYPLFQGHPVSASTKLGLHGQPGQSGTYIVFEDLNFILYTWVVNLFTFLVFLPDPLNLYFLRIFEFTIFIISVNVLNSGKNRYELHLKYLPGCYWLWQQCLIRKRSIVAVYSSKCLNSSTEAAEVGGALIPGKSEWTTQWVIGHPQACAENLIKQECIFCCN